MLICHPFPRERENTPPPGHIMLPEGCIMCPLASNTALRVIGAELEALGQIMQPSGSIICPLGGVFSLIPPAGVAYCTNTTPPSPKKVNSTFSNFVNDPWAIKTRDIHGKTSKISALPCYNVNIYQYIKYNTKTYQYSPSFETINYMLGRGLESRNWDCLYSNCTSIL